MSEVAGPVDGIRLLTFGYQADQAAKRSGKRDLSTRSRLICWVVSYRPCAFLAIQVDPSIALCCLLSSPVQYRRAEPRQYSFSPLEVGFSCGSPGRGLLPQWPLPSGA
jgi:hypothetical protein